MDDETLYAICDLYEKALYQLEFFSEAAPSLIALVEALTDTDPKFAEVYRQKLQAAKKQPSFQSLPQMIDSVSQAIQTIKARRMN